MQATSYQYEPLSRQDEIRLLHLSKGEDGDIRFRLSCEILDTTLSYEAISYMWGSSIRETPICHAESGETAFVTENCKRILYSLLHTGNDRIWIDGLCMNQDDVAERSQQVRLMGSIFRNAKRTIAYAGERDEHSRAVFAWSGTPIRDWPNVVMNQVPIKDDEHATKFLQRPFFSRTWVIQEALLSEKFVVRVGTEELGFHFLRIWDYKLGRERASPRRPQDQGVVTLKAAFSHNPKAPQLWHVELSDRRRMRQGEVLWETPMSTLNLITKENLLNPGYLFDVLCATSHYQCLDPRDKVFSLLSLFEHRLPEELQPDYSCSVEKLYTSVSRYLLRYGVARVLAASQGCNATNSMPSWAIDWRNKISSNALGREDGVFASPSSAGFDTSRHMNVRILSPGQLLVRGYSLAHVDGTSTPIRADAQEKIAALSGSRPLHDYVELVDTKGPNKRSGLIPKDSRKNDLVYILLGFTVPFVLRVVPKERMQVVGECYLDGYMNGEAVRGLTKDHVYDEDVEGPIHDFVLF